MDGIIIIDKPKNYTSRDVVNKLNHLLGTKKIGHTGTLDPLATGVLVCMIGKYTKLVNLVTSYTKEYIAEITLGISTDTLDITGTILEEQKVNITKEEILTVFKKYLGKYLQQVPNYFAVKINGKKLYEYARENKEVKLPSREVEVFSLELLDFQDNKITFKTKVSKGTYIRSLISDICSSLNTIGTMSELTRTKQGNFFIENACTLEDIENNHYQLLKAEDVFDYPKIEVTNDMRKKIQNGGILEDTFNIKDKVLFMDQNNCLAIYEKKDSYLKIYVQL